jgi:hypothetical protein
VPANNPTYIPAAVLPSTTLTAPGSVVFQTNSVGTLYFNLSGTNTGLAATIQGAVMRAGTLTWVNLSAIQTSYGLVTNISANGLYRVNASGFAQIRLNLTAIASGSLAVAASAGMGQSLEDTLPVSRATYSAAALIGTGATTHFLTIAGSATTTIRITHVECSGKATAALAVNITAEVDSTADSGDAGTTLTATPHDPNVLAAAAVVKTHTTSPTPGTLTGLVRAGTMTIVNAATPVSESTISWDFGNRPAEAEVYLRGVAQSFSLNTSAAFGTGAAVGCSVTWTEM